MPESFSIWKVWARAIWQDPMWRILIVTSFYMVLYAWMPDIMTWFISLLLWALTLVFVFSQNDLGISH